MVISASDVTTDPSDPISQFLTQAVTSYDQTIVQNNLSTSILIIGAMLLFAALDS